MRERNNREIEKKKLKKEENAYQDVELVWVLHELHAGVVDDHLVVDDVGVLLVDLAAALE